jgi:hypothetical protein
VSRAPTDRRIVPRDHHAVSGEFEVDTIVVDPDADTQPIVIPATPEQTERFRRATDAKPGRKARFG